MDKKLKEAQEFCKLHGISIYRFNEITGVFEMHLLDFKPVYGKFCTAYYCPSQVKTNNKKPWKIQLNTGQHVKWVATREEAELTIKNFEN